MTVHGAKGLEAPIVILPDTGKRDIQIKDDILSIAGTPVWKTGADEMPAQMRATVDAMKEAQQEERLRLLYVALTRAEKWLIVAAAGDLPASGDSWYQMVDRAMYAAGAVQAEFQGLDIKRLGHADWDSLPLATAEAGEIRQVDLAPFFSQPAPPPAPRVETVSPSDLGGAKALAGDAGRSEEAARAYGSLVHTALEHLDAAGADDWPRLIAALTDDANPDTALAAEEAARVLAHPDLRFLFGASTLSEVPVSADLGTARLHGIIDRLVIGAERILAVDFKTNQVVPDRPEDCPDGILRQMAAYAVALRQIYPGKRIDTAIVWTNTCTFMPLPHDIVMRSLDGTPYLDAPAASS
jgi:ATP-dependent helicase/nuclease subunit A